MTQKELIIKSLKETKAMTQGDLSVALYGDRNHLPNLYMSLMDLVKKGLVLRYGDHPAYYSLSENVDNLNILNSNFSSQFIETVDVPKPSVEQVEYWLHEWDSLEDYVAQEEAIDRLFHGEFKSNDNIQNILIKCSVLNDFYSTNIFKIYPVAKRILSLNIDKRLADGDTALVDDIAKNTFGEGKDKYFYSFASKHCSHHNQLEFPIYDSYVHKVLMHFKKIDRFFSFKSEDLKKYSKFKNVLIEFREFYGLEKYNLKELDKYLWQLGKRYFPNKY